jgi:hypothetical protein
MKTGGSHNSIAEDVSNGLWHRVVWRAFIHSLILSARQLMPRMHLSLGLIVQPVSVHSAQIQQPYAFYVAPEVS